MSVSEPLIKIKKTQLDDDYQRMGLNFDSLCFAEGAIQSFELNWTNFREDRPLNVQTSIAHIVRQLMAQMNGSDLLRDSCRRAQFSRLDFLRQKFMSREVDIRGLENLAAGDDFKDEDRRKLKRFLRTSFGEYKSSSERWRERVFDALVTPNLDAEKNELEMEFRFDALVRKRRAWMDSFTAELEDKFKERGEMSHFTRLVRKSEEIVESFSVRTDQLKKDFFGPLRKMNQKVLRGNDKQLMKKGAKQNRRFWRDILRDFRKRGKDEKTCDYVDHLVEVWTRSFRRATERVDADRPNQSSPDEELWALLREKQSSFARIQRQSESLWKQASDEVAKLWQDEFPDEDANSELQEPPKDAVDLEWSIIESVEDWPQSGGDTLAKTGLCSDPVRDFLDPFYQEMLGLEIGYSPVDALVFAEGKVERSQQAESGLRSEYRRIVEVIRAYKTNLDRRVWTDLRGSMRGWERVRRKWAWTLREMREEWQERVETKRRTLLVQGARLQDIQNAIREHDRWLERLEHEDGKLFETQVENFQLVRTQVSHKLKSFYRRQARDLNLEVWRILDSRTWVGSKGFRGIGDRLMKFLSTRDERVDLGRWAPQLTHESSKLEASSSDINQTHLEFWTKALLESDLYWEDLIRGIREENEEHAMDTQNRLQCYGEDVFDAAEEPLDLGHVHSRWTHLEVTWASLARFAWQFVSDNSANRDLLDSFYRRWRERIRAWKAVQFEQALVEYLPGRQRFLKLIEEYLKAREQFARLRMDHQTEIKRRWILKNDSPKSLDQLTLVLEEVESSWRRNGISNDERLGSFKNKLAGFMDSVHLEMLDMAREINQSLFDVLRRGLRGDEGSEGVSETLHEVTLRVRRAMAELRTRWRVHLDEVSDRLQFDGSSEAERLLDSLKQEVTQENDFLSSQLDELSVKRPDEPKVEFECSKDIIQEIELPLLDSFQKMISNEVSLGTVRRVLWPVLGPTNRDKLGAWSAVVRHHQLWVERARAYKVEMHEQVVEMLFNENPHLVEIFETWNERVNRSISSWKEKSHSMVAKYIEDENGTAIIAKIKARTESFINDAMEMDSQLQKHYFETYFEKLPQLEMEVSRDFAKLATVINLNYFFSLKKVVELYRTRESSTSLADPIYSVLDTVWKGLLLWFSDGIPAIDEEHWRKTLVGSVRIIIRNKRKILGEHRELWEVLNKKFDLAGPDGSMESVIDQGGKCDVFKLIRGPSID